MTQGQAAQDQMLPGQGKKASRVNHTVDVAIIGAGPAGLTAAYLLTRAGYSVAIIEKNVNHVGGSCRTLNVEGYRLDLGGRSFTSRNPKVEELWNQILPDAFTQTERRSRVFYHGGYYNFPPKPLEVMWNFGFSRTVRVLASMAKARIMPRKEEHTLEDWAVNRYGRRLHGMFFKTYAKKHWGIPTTQISAEWAVRRFKPARGGKRAAMPFKIPREGSGQMWDAARDQVLASGRGSILMGHTLKSLSRDGSGQNWRISAHGSVGERMITARHVINSAPLRDLVARLHPLPESAMLVQKLKYRHSVTIGIKLASSELPADHTLYIQDGRVKVSRIHNYGQMSPDMVPEAGMSFVGMEYFCDTEDKVWKRTDDELIEMAMRELEVLRFAWWGQFQGGFVVRQEKARPITTSNCTHIVKSVRGELERMFPALHLVGGNALHLDCHHDHAMLTAMRAVDHILSRGDKIAAELINDHVENAAENEAGQDMQALFVASASLAGSHSKTHALPSDDSDIEKRRVA